MHGRCRTELTRTHLDTSVITVHTSRDNSQPCSPSFRSTKWTDQQHSSYLKSLETSFVNQLHHLLVLRGWNLQNNLREPHSRRQLPDQYLGLQDSCRQKINLERTESMLESTADSHVSLGNQSSPHLTAVEGKSDTYDLGLLCNVNLTRNPESSGRLQSSDNKGRCSFWHPHVAEVSDQNFDEETKPKRQKS